MAQSTYLKPSQTIQQQIAKAQSLYDKHSYAEATAILERLSTDPQNTALPDWPDRLYDLACDQVLAGQPAKALITLKQAFALGSGPHVSTSHLRNDPDLVSLHNDPQFHELLISLAKREALWQDDPAIATPYKPVLTDAEKIAGLSKFWSEARFNFPFFSRLPDLAWDRAYMEYLPQVIAAQTTADYYRVMMRFAATLHDGHTEIWTPQELGDSLHGMPLLRTQLIEDRVLVTEIHDPALTEQGIHAGTEVVSIDGQPVREYAANHVAPYASGSTPQDRSSRTYGYMLMQGQRDQPVQLTWKDPNGKTGTVSIHRYCEPSSQCSSLGIEPVQFKMLPGNIAYLAVNEFEDDLGAKAMLDHFASITQAQGLIVDVRRNTGGNQHNAMTMLAMLTDKPFSSVSCRTLNYKPVIRAQGSAPEWLNLPDTRLAP